MRYQVIADGRTLYRGNDVRKAEKRFEALKVTVNGKHQYETIALVDNGEHAMLNIHFKGDN